MLARYIVHVDCSLPCLSFQALGSNAMVGLASMSDAVHDI